MGASPASSPIVRTRSGGTHDGHAKSISRHRHPINNAGIGYFATVESLTTEQFERMVGYLIGLFYLLRRGSRCCVNAAGGDVVNISFAAGVNPFMLGPVTTPQNSRSTVF